MSGQPRKTQKSKGSSWSDHYTKKAQQSGFLARSVFKLDEIAAKFRILSQCSRMTPANILDLGSAPGSWLQWCLSHRALQHAKIYSVDLQNLDNSLHQKGGRLHHFVGDMCAESLFALMASYAPYALILCDAAPASTGQKLIDKARSHELNCCAIRYAQTYLAQGGNFVCKLFLHERTKALYTSLKPLFAQLALFKPQSSRSSSREQYLIALQRNTLDPDRISQ